MPAFNLTQAVSTDSAGVPRIELTITVDPPDPIGVFDGFVVWRQLPSGRVSAAQQCFYDGDPDGIGSARYGTVKVYYPPPASTENWKILVAPHSKNSEPTLVLTGVDATPNETISVNAVTPIVPQIPGDVRTISGNAFNISVSLLTADPNGNRFQRFTITYDPPLPISPFIGVACYVVPPDNEPRFLGTFDYDGDGTNSTPGRYGSFIVDLDPATSAGESWMFYLVPRSVNYTAQFNLSTTPHRSITALTHSGGGLLPALPSSIVGEQATSGSIYRQVATSELLETRILVTVNMPSGHTATGINLWVSVDSGTSWEEVGNFAIDSDTQTSLEFWWPAPPATTGWRIKAITYGSGGWNDPNSTVVSGPFTANAASALPSNVVTDATLSAAISYTQAGDGQYYYGFSISWTNPSIATHPYWRLTKVYVREVDSGGNPVSGALGELRHVDEFDRENVPISLVIPDRWIIPPSGQKVRLYLYAVDLLGFEVLQTTAWSGQPYLELTPVQQIGTAGQEYAPAIGLGSFTGTAPTGFFGEDGAQMYYFTMRCSAVPSSPSYQGFKGYAAPRGVVSATNGSGTYTRVSGPYFNSGQIGQKVDVSGVILTIATVPSATQFTAEVWTSGSGSGTSVMLGEARQVIVAGRDDTAVSSPKYPVNHVSEDFRLYALSMDYAGRTNSYKAGVTPIVDVTVSRSNGSAGQEWTGVVTALSPETSDFTGQGLSVVNCIAILTDGGILLYFISGSYADPIDPATGQTRADFGGVKIVRLNASDPFKSIEVADYGKGAQRFRSDFQPSGAGSITFAFLSYDTSGRMNQYQAGVTPTFTATTPAQTNTLNLAKVLPGSLVTSAFASGIRPVALVAALPALPDANYPPGSWAYVTPAGPRYAVNSAGTGWELGVKGQDIVADSITAIQIATGAIGASEIATGDLLVGGLGKLNSRMIVRDLSNNIVVAMGDFGGVQMFHAINARIGTNVNAPFFYADSTKIALGANALGFANVLIDAAGVSFQNCLTKFTASDGTTVSINNDILGGAFRGLAVYTSSGTNAVVLRPGNITLTDTVSGGFKATLSAPSGAGASFTLYNASAQQAFWLFMNPSGSYPSLALYNGIGGFKNGYGGIAPITFQYLKPGGITGTIEVTAGWITSVT